MARYIALVNKQTSIVDNVIVAPQGANAWFHDERSHNAIFVDGRVARGDKWDAENERFIPYHEMQEPAPVEDTPSENPEQP